MKVKIQRNFKSPPEVKQEEQILSQEILERFVKDFYTLKSSCFMCHDIVKKIEQKRPLTDGDQYHISVCLPSLRNLRQGENEK